MKIAGVADQHGKLSVQAPAVDVLAIVGDFVPLLSTAENWQQWRELDWIHRKYVRWLRRQEFDACLVVPGNHDIVLYSPDTRAEAIAALESVPGVSVWTDDSPTWDVHGVVFAGYPYTPTIQQRRWAYSLPRGDERVTMALERCIPDEADVVLSHGPPWGALDVVEGRHEGCSALTRRLIDVSPKNVICGHIHESRGERDRLWNSLGRQTRLVNASICDRAYVEKYGRPQLVEV